ncbi:uncharacterized protein LOC125784832 isoform X1 [Astyanax mexicanus]|nr:uncharacterized protein LOC125784832 isoform X1 [Astyanax mexicanus]
MIVAVDFEDITFQTPFRRHFRTVIESAPLDLEGPPNEYYSKTFINSLATNFLPHAALWTSMMLGDLGRHGKGLPYENFSKKFSKISKKTAQNFTKDNKTQGIMEKSQWDLKQIRFQRRRLTRLDDFVTTYQDTHIALLREFADVEKTRRRVYRIQTEKWKQRKRNKRGVYVSPIRTPFLLKSKQVSKETTSSVTTACVLPEANIQESKTAKSPDNDKLKIPSSERDLVTLITSTPSTSCEPSTSLVQREKKTTKKKRGTVHTEKSSVKETAEKRGNHGPIWGNYSPQGVIPTGRLSRPVSIHHDQMISILDPHTWLTSDEMDSASYYMAQKYASTDGFQSSLLFSALRRGGIVGTPRKPFVQILNINDNHWIAASNIFCGSNEVCIYDSLNTTINKTTQQMLSWMLRPEAPHFVLRKPAVQIQHSGSNCGVLALAFAAALCERIRPEECQFREKELRQRLYRGLVEKRVPEFPFEKAQAKPEREAVQVEVYCVCRTSHNNEVMVQCSKCNAWYHPNCVPVPSSALDTTMEEWHCQNCKA